MFSKVTKYLSILVLLTLTACVTAGPQNLKPRSSATSRVPAYPPSTPYLEPVLSPTTRPLGKPIQQSTLTPSPHPSPPPSATISASMQASANSRMTQLKLFNANNGWAVQTGSLLSENKILHTTNGLRNWDNVSPPGPEGYYIDLTASFFDANNAMVLYNWQALPTSNTSEITTWRTHDGG